MNTCLFCTKEIKNTEIFCKYHYDRLYNIKDKNFYYKYRKYVSLYEYETNGSIIDILKAIRNITSHFP
jgi:hypothetical protein